MKQYQLTNLGACCRCHKKLAQTASPMFFTLKVERWMLDIMAVQRQIGLEMQIGPLAGVMGPDEDLAEKIGESKTMMICIECSFRDVVIAALAEGSGWGEQPSPASERTAMNTTPTSTSLAATPLFAFMVDVRKTPSLAAKRRQQVAEWKGLFRIFTHKGPDDWMALSMDECCWKLEGYGLTKEEQTDGVMLMAGYCRLIDEAGLIHYGETEHEACESLVARLTEANDQTQQLGGGK